MTKKRLGLLIHPGEPTNNGVIRGVIRFVQTYGGWHIATHYAVPSLAWRSLRPWQGDGLIAMVYFDAQYQALLDKGLPVVNASSRVETRRLPTVCSDNLAIGRMAAEHLMGLGLRYFAGVGRGGLHHDRRRVDGFERAVIRRGHRCERLEFPVQRQTVNDLSYLRFLLRKIPPLPTPIGIFAAHDNLGCLVLKACSELDLKVPYDVAVVGVNNYELLCETAQPPLTSICQNAERIGFEAARLLDQITKGTAEPVEHLEIPPGELVKRRSTDFLAFQDPDVAAALVFIHEHASEPITVEHVLQHLAVSRRTLDKKFCEILGHPPAAEIRSSRIRRAQDLLARTDEQIVMVAAGSGFRSVSGFQRAFREHTGLTPRQYRRQFR